MKLEIYPRLFRESQLAMVRQKWKGGYRYYYKPRGNLLKRLEKETGQNLDWILDQIDKERKYLIENPQFQEK